jgi:hypothetical protein
VSAENAARIAAEYGVKRNGIDAFLNSCAGIKTITEHLADKSFEENELFDFIEFLLTKKAVALHL